MKQHSKIYQIIAMLVISSLLLPYLPSEQRPVMATTLQKQSHQVITHNKPVQVEQKQNAPVVAVTPPLPESQPTATTIQPIIDEENDAKLFIYQHESGNNPARVNSIGCKGLGQDCNGKLPSVCPDWQTDYACQDEFFTNYMLHRYGSWTKAKAFWVARVQINGRDVGNWW
jgi:hypothetical protein